MQHHLPAKQGEITETSSVYIPPTSGRRAPIKDLPQLLLLILDREHPSRFVIDF